MKLAVYGTCLGGKATGIANMVINMLNSLSEDHEVTVFSISLTEDAKQRITRRNIRYILPKHKHWSARKLTFEMTRLINSEKFDYFWFPSPNLPVILNKKVKRVVGVHDFVSKEFRQTLERRNAVITKYAEPGIIRNADKIICNSEYTKNKLEEYYPKIKCRKIYVGDAADPFLHKIDPDPECVAELYKKTGITKKFIMFVGSLEPRKNLSFLLKVFKKFAESNELQLVIVGGTGWGNTGIAEIINEPGYPKSDVLFPGYLNMEELRLLYNTAECYVSTSLNEGFGLPQLEAMNCGCPVVTANNSAMTEVSEGAGVTVDGWDIDEWTKAIEYAINNREMIIARQDERRQKYTWEKVAKGFESYLTETDS